MGSRHEFQFTTQNKGAPVMIELEHWMFIFYGLLLSLSLSLSLFQKARTAVVHEVHIDGLAVRSNAISDSVSVKQCHP
jgi:hypothetical protein